MFLLLMGKENLLIFEPLCVLAGPQNALLGRRVCYATLRLRHNSVFLCCEWEKKRSDLSAVLVQLWYKDVIESY